MTDLRYLGRADGTRIAYRHREGRGPTLVYLGGYISEMIGTKASALDAWAEEQGRAMLRLDYAGYGESDGDFEAQGLDDRLNDVLTVVDQVTTGPLVLVGSSMGGWIALLAALARPNRVAAVDMEIQLPAELSPARRAGLLAQAGHCTVHNTITHTPDIAITLVPASQER